MSINSLANAPEQKSDTFTKAAEDDVVTVTSCQAPTETHAAGNDALTVAPAASFQKLTTRTRLEDGTIRMLKSWWELVASI